MQRLTTRHGLFFAALSSVLLCAACDDAPEPETSATPVTAPMGPKVAPPQALPPEMVTAVAAGKSVAEVGLHFALRGQPTIGNPVDIDVALVPRAELISLAVAFESQQNLAVVSGEQFGPASDVAINKPLTHRVTLMPSAEGVYLLSASAKTETVDGTVTSTFSIPLIVSTAAPNTPAPAAAPKPTTP
jgi:hypothetical protein